MSIVCIHNKEIDSESWNLLVENTPQSRIYSTYEYLTAVNPHWMALMELQNGLLKSAFPLTEKSVLGLKYFVQPILVQQLEILGSSPPSEKFIEALENKLKSYKSLRIHLNSNSTELLRSKGLYLIKERQTLVLNLRQKEEGESGYSKNHKRNIKKAKAKGFKVEISNDFNSVLEGYLDNKGNELNVNKEFELRFKSLSKYFERLEQAKVYLIQNENDKIIAGAVFLGFKKTMTFLLSFSNPEAKSNGGMHMLIDDWISNRSVSYDFLDFEGGNIDSLERFYKGSGAESQYFNYLIRHEFPFNLFFLSR